MNDHKSQDNYDAQTLILNDSNGNELFCYLEQIAVSYTHLTLPTKRIV